MIKDKIPFTKLFFKQQQQNKQCDKKTCILLLLLCKFHAHLMILSKMIKIAFQKINKGISYTPKLVQLTQIYCSCYIMHFNADLFGRLSISETRDFGLIFSCNFPIAGCFKIPQKTIWSPLK